MKWIVNYLHVISERVWRNGSASASQAEGCGFESRRPLQISFEFGFLDKEYSVF